MSEKKVFSYNWGGRQLQVEIGQLAKQANGAVLVRYGDTVVLTAAVGTKQAKDTDFFPLTVNYEEKMYAAGKIPGGFINGLVIEDSVPISVICGLDQLSCVQ